MVVEGYEVQCPPTFAITKANMDPLQSREPFIDSTVLYFLPFTSMVDLPTI